MTEFSIMYMMGAGIGALIAIYVILAVLIALGVYALVRLAILAKMKRKPAPAKDCANCPTVKEKDDKIASLESEAERNAAALSERDQEIVRLNEIIKELQARPAVVIPAETRTLSESLAAASAVAGSKISKKSIIAYLSDKYGKAVELNGRANRTPNGKLLMSDNHFAFSPEGKRVCFVYVYETDEGNVVSLIKLDEPYVEGLIPAHPDVKRSAFPKNKAKDWYSVVADDTFTEASYYAVLDHAIALIRGMEEPALPAEETEVSLSESLAAAKATGAAGVVTKQSIIDHLAKTFGDKVELNGRANRTPNGKLLLSDNHFAFAPDGKRVCFSYIYQDDDGKVIILLRTKAEHAKDIHAAHKATGVKSAFPKNKEKDWYSVIVDDTFTEAGVYAEIDRAVGYIIGSVPTIAPVADTEVSLRDSLAAAKETGAVGIVTKQSIIDHLSATFGDKVELNGRANRTLNGKLLLSDNHFAFAPDGKRVCFTYTYQDDDGKVIILLRTTAEHAQAIRAAHKATGVKSAFPKNKEKDWYSVVVDGTFSAQSVYALLDRAVQNIIGAETAPVPVEEAPAEVSFSESLAAAKETGAVGIVTKQSIIDHLSRAFGDKVELNGRENRTPNGKLLMSDNHFAFAPDGKRVCFTYIYQDDDGKVIILLRITAEHAKDIHAAHKATGIKSAFPKNKEKDWYSVIVDDTFTASDVYAELDRAVTNITGTAPAEVPVEEKAEEIVEEKPEEILAADVAEEAAEEAPALSAEESERTDTEEVDPASEYSLSESLDRGKTQGAVGVVTKQSIMEHLAETFGDKVELNGRPNRTEDGKLLMSDNHFAFAPDGKRVCFTYIYQDDDGKVVILLRTSEKHAKSIHAAHKATGVKSAFPKNAERDWYSVVVDATFTEQDVYDVLDKAAQKIIAAEEDTVDEVVEIKESKTVKAPEPIKVTLPIDETAEYSLSESLAAARDNGAVGIVNKQSIIAHLAKAFGDKVELNGRENRTPNGKLLMSDNHFAVGEGKRVCFTYIYEDDGKVMMLVRLSDEAAAAIRKAHKATGVRSAFPKNKENDWYSVIVDDSFSEGDVYAVLDESYAYVLTK